MASSVEVHPVPPESIVVLRNVVLPDHPRDREEFVAELQRAVGHERFVLLLVRDAAATVETLTDPEAFPQWLVDKIAEAQDDLGAGRRVAEVPDRPRMRLPSGQRIRRATDEEAASYAEATGGE